MITQKDVIEANKTLIHLTEDLYKPNIFFERLRKQKHYEQNIEDIISGKIQFNRRNEMTLELKARRLNTKKWYPVREINGFHVQVDLEGEISHLCLECGSEQDCYSPYWKISDVEVRCGNHKIRRMR